MEDDLKTETAQDDSQRQVDTTTATQDVLALNNVVVSMRGLAKRVRVHVINNLSKKAKHLRTKKGSEEEVAQNGRKADRFVEEIKVLKGINLDHASKFALANEKTFDEVAQKNGSFEERAKTRMATHKLMEEHVKTWRDKHEDWQALAAFMLSKNTGRRFKKVIKMTQEPVSSEQEPWEESAKILQVRQEGVDKEGSLSDRLQGISEISETVVEEEIPESVKITQLQQEGAQKSGSLSDRLQEISETTVKDSDHSKIEKLLPKCKLRQTDKEESTVIKCDKVDQKTDSPDTENNSDNSSDSHTK